MGGGIPLNHLNKKYAEYFDSGNLDRRSMYEWIHVHDSEGKMPDAIVNEREGQLYLNVGGVV